MNPNDLLDDLDELIKEQTKDLLLPLRFERGESGENGEKFRAPLTFTMDLPKKEDDTRLTPYILTQILTGTDEQKPAEDPSSMCSVRIVVVLYCENMGEGKRNVLNVITRLRMELLRRKTIGKHFVLADKIDWVVDPRPVGSYFSGEMLMNFKVPPIEPDDRLSDEADNREEYLNAQEDSWFRAGKF